MQAIHRHSVPQKRVAQNLTGRRRVSFSKPKLLWNKALDPKPRFYHRYEAPDCLVGKGNFKDFIFVACTRHGLTATERIISRLDVRSGKRDWTLFEHTEKPCKPWPSWPMMRWNRQERLEVYNFKFRESRHKRSCGIGKWSFQEVFGSDSLFLWTLDPIVGRPTRGPNTQFYVTAQPATYGSDVRYFQNTLPETNALGYTLGPGEPLNDTYTTALMAKSSQNLVNVAHDEPAHGFFLPAAFSRDPHEFFLAESGPRGLASSVKLVRYLLVPGAEGEAHFGYGQSTWQQLFKGATQHAFAFTANGKLAITHASLAHGNRNFQISILEPLSGEILFTTTISPAGRGPFVPVLAENGSLVLVGTNRIVGMDTQDL